MNGNIVWGECMFIRITKEDGAKVCLNERHIVAIAETSDGEEVNVFTDEGEDARYTFSKAEWASASVGFMAYGDSGGEMSKSDDGECPAKEHEDLKREVVFLMTVLKPVLEAKMYDRENRWEWARRCTDAVIEAQDIYRKGAQ